MDTLTRDGGEGIRYGMADIDRFTKVAEVTPIENIQTTELIPALKLTFRSIGKPKQLYSDEESSFRTKVFFRYINENDIKRCQTSTHAPSAERLIGTFKDSLHRRLDGLKQERKEWTKHVSSILTKYNNTEHSTIQIKPIEAVKSENHLRVSWHLQNNIKKDRKYPKIKEGDMARVNIKKRIILVNLMNLFGVQRGIKLLA